jgi:hypothetical protein
VSLCQKGKTAPEAALWATAGAPKMPEACFQGTGRLEVRTQQPRTPKIPAFRAPTLHRRSPAPSFVMTRSVGSAGPISAPSRRTRGFVRLTLARREGRKVTQRRDRP